MSLGVSRRAKLVIFKIALTLLLAAAVVVIAYFVSLDRYSWIISHRISAALQGARTVTLMEYVPGKIIARKTATPDEIARLQSAAGKWFYPFRSDISVCWEPHHSIEIVRADGSDVIVEICFLCGKFGFLSDDEPVVPLPPSLSKSLTAFFTSVGMRPKTHEEYFALEPSTNDLQAEKARKEFR